MYQTITLIPTNTVTGVITKVRYIVRGGAVVALSLGLAGIGSGMGLTASESTPTHAQPEELVGGGGGSGGEVVTYFSASFVQKAYDLDQGYAPSIGSALCNHMTPYNAAAVSYCQDNVSVSLGHAIDLACAPGSNCPEVALTYDVNGDVWYSIF